jgi:hypothetical protein
MALATPGGWSRGNFSTADCALCGCWVTMGNGWRNIALEAVVCGTCMVDPWAELPRKVKLDADPGPPHYVGERVAAEVRAALGVPGAGRSEMPA